MGYRTIMSPNRAQGSVYNLTLDEVQSQLGNIGKPLNNMNLDELLKNVTSVEQGQVVQNPCPSSHNLNGTLSKKTVDEVWKEIVHHDNQSVQQQLTLGETTLEDFLVRAGVINRGNQNGVLNSQQIMGIDPMVVVSQQADWLQFQMASVQQQQQQQQMTVFDSNFNVSESVYESPGLDVGYSENQLAITVPVTAMSATSSDSQYQAAAERKRRYSDEMMEKTIERRQKRMIKNRESAARSRARKQAYTNQLEHEVFHFRKTNNWLKKQKEVEMLLSSDPTSMPKYQLRRTSSAPF